ncbi:LysR family transcriptional regulator, partial [Mesorhizobium sp. M7A.T.Ca.TU.009.01.1.1]
PEIAGLPALPKMALVLHQKDAELDPVAARLADILLQAALQALPRDERLKEVA